jgi:ferrochelatase
VSSGLLVMAYGSPTSADDIETYYTRIRRGRPPTEQQLANLVHRYEAIGGTSALAERTAEQVRAITLALSDTAERSGGRPASWVVALGTKHSMPDITEGMTSLLESGVDRIVGLVLAPHYSAASVGEYHRQAVAGLEDIDGVTYHRIDSWHTLDALIGFQGAQVRRCLDALPERTEVVFTAHSLPERVLTNDPYPEQLYESAAAIAERAGLAGSAGWGLGWQSAGATPEPWRGPDLVEIITELASTGRCDALLVVPQGFTSEHLEVLYDIDIEAALAAEQAGLTLARTQLINNDPGVMSALASLVKTTADAG